MRISSVILAGGRGERLFPITNTRPKPLCPVAGTTPLERCIRLARTAGALKIYVLAGYMPQSIIKATENQPDVSVITEPYPLSTAGAVKNAKPKGDIILVLCGDTVCDFDLRFAIKSHIESRLDATIVTTETTCPIEYGVVNTVKNCVSSFVEKPSWQHVNSNVINTGIYVLSRRVLELVPDGEPYDFGSQLFPSLLKNGYAINTYNAAGYWCDMGTPETYYSANLREAVELRGAVHPSCDLSPRTVVTRSVLMEKVTAGAGTVIDRSIICENVKIGRNCIIPPGCVIGADSIIEDGCIFSEGITVTNSVTVGKGARVMKNIYSNQQKSRLFDKDIGVGGIYGANFDIADAVYLGQSLCMRPDRNERVKVGVMSGNGSFSRILAGVTMGGIRFGGGECVDLGNGFLSMCGFAARELALDYSVFVEVDNDFGIYISVFDKYGLFVTREEQRRLERVFLRREQKTRVLSEDDRTEKSENVASLYKAALVSGTKSLKSLKVGIKSDSTVNTFLKDALESCGAEITETDCDIFDVCDDGLYLSAKTKSGRTVTFWHFICYAFSERASKGKRIALPSYAPLSVIKHLEGLGGELVYFSDSETDDRRLVGAENRFFDGCMLAFYVLNKLKAENKELDDMLSELPVFYVREARIAIEESQKAEKAKELYESCSDSRNGMAFLFGAGRVMVTPSNESCFRLFAEAVNSEAADELCDEMRKRIEKS